MLTAQRRGFHGMSLSIKQQGDYRLHETRERRRKLLILSETNYDWRTEVREDLLSISHSRPSEGRGITCYCTPTRNPTGKTVWTTSRSPIPGRLITCTNYPKAYPPPLDINAPSCTCLASSARWRSEKWGCRDLREQGERRQRVVEQVPDNAGNDGLRPLPPVTQR